MYLSYVLVFHSGPAGPDIPDGKISEYKVSKPISHIPMKTVQQQIFNNIMPQFLTGPGRPNVGQKSVKILLLLSN